MKHDYEENQDRMLERGFWIRKTQRRKYKPGSTQNASRKRLENADGRALRNRVERVFHGITISTLNSEIEGS